MWFICVVRYILFEININLVSIKCCWISIKIEVQFADYSSEIFFGSKLDFFQVCSCHDASYKLHTITGVTLELLRENYHVVIFLVEIVGGANLMLCN